MGPRFDERGKRKSQLKHPLPPPQVASMGPRFDERGKHVTRHHVKNLWQASMGPQSMSRGKAAVMHADAGGDELQWGRASMSAES